jgi:putative toxin-antitoxin system antitoxin component (TIGR02293 family)
MNRIVSSFESPRLKPSSGPVAVAKFYERAISAARPRTAAGRRTRKVFVSHRGELSVSVDAASHVISEGLAANVVESVLAAVTVDKSKILEAIGIDKATLRRREAARGRLAPIEAAGTIRAMALVTRATEVFGTVEAASSWLNKPHPLLANKSPMAFASNEFGASKIEGMLIAIRYGGVV